MVERRYKIIIGLIILFIFSTIFSFINIGNEKILNNTQIQHINVAGMTQNEAEEEINKKYREKKLNQIKLKHNDYETTISFEQLDVEFNSNNAIKQAYGRGRTGNIITNNYAILFSGIFKKDIPIELSIKDELLNDITEDTEKKLPDVKKEYTYYIDGVNLIIHRGTPGVVIDKDELKRKIREKLEDFNSSDNIIEIPVKDAQPSDIEIGKIISEIKKEPKDAYISENPLEIHVEQDGIELAITEKEAEEMLKEEKSEYTIPLKVVKPSITVASLGDKAFTDRLSTFTTIYDINNENRNNNLVLAAEKLNGTIVNPNEEFSYNKTIGERTISAGFKEANAYANGDVVLDVGGGICQLSSTLYNAVLLSNLEVTERHNHYFKTSYVEEGRDATVSWGTVDFKFKNNRKYPLKIEATAENGVVTVTLHGIKEPEDYTVLIESKVTSIIEKETEKVKEGQAPREGEDGCTSETYKTLTKNGVIISKTLVSKDTYNALSKRE